MKKLGVLTELDINPDASVVDTAGFWERRAARAVVFDDDGRVALLHVTKHGYHKLPGGGIDEGEDIAEALQRELLEEIGTQARVTAEIGEITEYRDQKEMKQTSYCYRARQFGEKGEPDFTEKELNDGFAIVWADNLAAAIALLESDTPVNYDGKFIQKRDLLILQAASELR